MRYCPTCRTDRPASAFLTTNEPDPHGAFLVCTPCGDEAADRRAFLRRTRKRAERNPASPLSAAVRSTRLAHHKAIRAAYDYAQHGTAATPALALSAAA